MINIRKLKGILILAAILVVSYSMFGHPQSARAANPTTINFQGKVVNANGTNVTDGTYSFTFKLYSVASGGVAIWGETQTTVSVLSGVFQVNLGSTCSLFTTQTCSTFSNTAIDFNANPALYLGITFNGDAAGEMTPRPQLQSVPYAFNADKVGGLSAAQLVQLSPATSQTGFIDINGGNTQINNIGTGNTTIGGSSGTIAVGGASAGVITLQSASAINLTASANSTLNFGASNLGITSSTLTIAPTTGVMTLGGTTPTLTATSGINLTVQSQGTGTLVLGTGSTGILSLTSATNTIQRTAVGTTTLDLNDGANTLLVLKNNAGGVANLDLYGGSLQTGAVPVTRLDNAGNLLNIGTYSSSIAATNGQTLATINNPATSANLFNVQNIAPNFGAAVAAGAFVNKNSYFGEEFNVYHVNGPIADLVYSRGDLGANANATAAAGQGELTYDITTTAAASSSATSALNTPGGVEQINAVSTNSGTSIADEYLGGANAVGTAQKSWLAANLPLYTAKVKMGLSGSSNVRYYVGLSDMQATVAGAPTNGIYFTNCSTSLGTTCDTTLRGVTESGGTATFVSCGTIDPTKFVYLRIEVRSLTDVHFYADLDVSNGISEIECGTGSSTTIPSVALTYMTKVDNTTAGAATATLSVDYVRIWQDDAADPGLTSDAAPTTTTDTAQGDTVTPGATTSSLNVDGTTPDSNPLPSTTSTALTSDTTGKPQVVTATASGFQLLDSSGKPLISFAQDGTANFVGALNVASASTTGGLNVGSDLSVAGLSTFQKLATFIAKTVFRQDVQFDGHITVAADSAGYATLRKTESTVHIKFKLAYDNPPVVSTNTIDGQFVAATVSNITTAGFDLSVATPASQDTNFSWTAIGVNDPQTAVNPTPAAAP